MKRIHLEKKEKLAAIIVLIILMTLGILVLGISLTSNFSESRYIYVEFKLPQKISPNCYKIEINRSFPFEFKECWVYLSLNGTQCKNGSAILNSNGILISNETSIDGKDTTLQYFDRDNNGEISAMDYFLLSNTALSSEYKIELRAPNNLCVSTIKT